MRYLVTIGLMALACGGASGRADIQVEVGTGGSGGAPSAGETSVTTGGRKTPQQVAAAGAGAVAEAGQGGEAEVGGGVAANGGATAAGSGGTPTSGGGGGEPAGGAPEPPDDTGCIERPWSGNPADLSEKLTVLDCSGCSNGAELGYVVPDWCGELACHSWFDFTKVAGKDALLLLPAPSDNTCGNANCSDAQNEPADVAGLKVQALLSLGSGFHLETDAERGLVTFELPLRACSSDLSCFAMGNGAKVALMAKPGTKRGWVRIHGDQAACQ